MKARSALLAGALAWHLMVPPALPSKASTAHVPEGQADAGGDSFNWIQFGPKYKSRSDCEAERTSLFGDPVVRQQMRQARCVPGRGPGQ